MKRKKKSASRRGGEILSVDTYSLMGDPVSAVMSGADGAKNAHALFCDGGGTVTGQ